MRSQFSGTMTPVLKKLEEKGLVSRQRSDIALDDVTQESIDRLLQYPAVSITQRLV